MRGSYIRGVASILALVILGVTGCGQTSAKSASAAATRSTGASAKPTSSTSATPPPSPSVSPASGTATPVCRTSDLKIAIVRGGVAAGTIGGYLSFTNKGNAPCHLIGWPNVLAIPATGKTRTAMRVHTTMFGPYNPAVLSVTIKPRERAEAVFTGHDVPVGPSKHCPPSYRQLKVTPPGNQQSVTISALLPAPTLGIYMPACSAIIISQVVARKALYHG